MVLYISLVHEVLKKYWVYDDFRPMQAEVIQAVLDGGEVLTLMPTGAGKSVCFQLPALMLEGITLVVSPLVALMKDQVLNLKEKGIDASCLYAGQSYDEQESIWTRVSSGLNKILYVSPERLSSKSFLDRIKYVSISILVVDEAHCISMWGHDFRPSYLRVVDFRKEFCPNKPCIALTATATPKVVEDIQIVLGFTKTQIFKTPFIRENLSFSVRKEADKYTKLSDVFKRFGQYSSIVYVNTRKETVNITQFLVKKGIRAQEYHAGLSIEQRNKHQQQWLSGEVPVIVCTSAFGMGIDKANVRLVVHWGVRDSLENYYQEAGRAGRDEQKAFALLIYDDQDLVTQSALIDKQYPDVDFIKRVYHAIGNYYNLAVGSHPQEKLPFGIEVFCEKYKLPTMEAYHALKILERNNYLSYQNSSEDSSKLKVVIDNTAIYKLQVSNESYEAFFKVLMRFYGGEILTHFVKVDDYNLANQLGWSHAKTIMTLRKLVENGAIKYIPKLEGSGIVFLQARADAQVIRIDREKLKWLKKQANHRLVSFRKYLNLSDKCRSVFFGEYFGDYQLADCGICDQCMNRDTKPSGLKLKVLEVVRLGENLQGIKRVLGKEAIEELRLLIDQGLVLREGDDLTVKE